MQINICLKPDGTLEVGWPPEQTFLAFKLLEHAKEVILQKSIALEQQQSVQPACNGQLAALLKARGGG